LKALPWTASRSGQGQEPLVGPEGGAEKRKNRTQGRKFPVDRDFGFL